MVKLTNITTNVSREVKPHDNTSLKIMAEEAGTLFGCEDGKCGSCRVEVINGGENFTPLTKKEEEMGIERPYRLLCQCKIKGDITIKTQ